MSIIDKLDKKISDKKNKNKLKEEEERLEDERRVELFKPMENFCKEVYKKHLADDFIRLEKLFVKHSQNQEAININFDNAGELLSDLEIILVYDPINYHTREIRIQFLHKDKKSVSSYSGNLKHIKAYKYLDTNFCLRVYSCTSSAEYIEFELKDKEKAYEYFADLFQKEIWEWGESTGNIK